MTLRIEEVSGLPRAQRVLRCCKSQLYFMENGWTDDPSQAEIFSDEKQAARVCAKHDLRDVELVVRSPANGRHPFGTVVR